MKLRPSKVARLSALSIAAVACDDDDGAVYLSSVITEPASEQCARGGHRFQAGLDENRDGTLSAGEVRTSSLLCLDDAPGAGGGGAGGRGDGGVAQFDCQIVPYDGPSSDAVWRREVGVLGGGFLALRGSSETTPTYYTRKAIVHRGADGCLVNELGFRLIGYEMDERGNRLTLPPEALCLRPEHLLGRATSSVLYHANFDAIAPTPLLPFDVTNLLGSTNAVFPIPLYDSLGQHHEGRIAFRRSAPGRWDYHVVVNGGEINGGTAGVAFEGASGTLVFNTDGALQVDVSNHSSWEFVGATPGQLITFDFGTSIDEGGTGVDGSTSVAAPTEFKQMRQDGYGAGALSLLRIGDDGIVLGGYTNLHDIRFGQIALATFPDPHFLTEVCSGIWAVTQESGLATYDIPGVEGRGGLAVRMPE